jgi:hypothetical protein
MYEITFERLNILILNYFYIYFLGNQKKKCGKQKIGECRENPQTSIEQNVAEAKTLSSDFEKVRIYITRRPKNLKKKYLQFLFDVAKDHCLLSFL